MGFDLFVFFVMMIRDYLRTFRGFEIICLLLSYGFFDNQLLQCLLIFEDSQIKIDFFFKLFLILITFEVLKRSTPLMSKVIEIIIHLLWFHIFLNLALTLTRKTYITIIVVQ